ncbi:hypothetical protein J8L70_01450 [Pseudoalteromonas sp. MMG010]|uniref:SdrD B-like domain-containing protein n=1 Tax=Pseudoalteromonas sp. MMG010 TaxID=2822685 RepID=UPI001B3A5573|nr:SdrD B-like domain-containing protein [Pseudoalteromonas sp. MMG010]MBQ4831897.1 hypothetical protein [Pseudoalteromonas sp. MMG010]
MWLYITFIILIAFSAFSNSAESKNNVYKTLFNIKQKWDEKESAVKSNLTSSLSLNNTQASKNIPLVGIPTGEFLVLSANVNGIYLGELFAIKSPNGAWIELNSLVEQLDFAIKVEPQQQQANGWFIYENNKFKLNITDEIATVNEKSFLLAKDDYYIDNGDIFISIEQLNNWFKLGITVDYGALKLNLNPISPLPIEKKIQRRTRTFYSSPDNAKPTLPWKASPYKAFSAPVADLLLSYTADESNNNLSYSLLGSQDLAYVNAEYFLSGQKNNLLSESRLSFSRQSNNADMLGVLGVSNIEFGDILAVRNAGDSFNSYSTGIKINNKPLYKEVNGNLVTLSGAVAAGWDVELYRNNVLIDQQLSLPDGRYYFEDVPLIYGSNSFELIFYGPQGQVERKLEEFVIDGNSLEDDESYYELSLSQQGQKLLEKNNSNESGWLLSGRYETGLSDYISLYSGGSSLFNTTNADDEVKSYTLGSNLSLLNKFLFNVNYNQNNKSEKDIALTARTEFYEQSLSLNATKSSSLASTTTGSEKFNDTRTLLFNMSGSLMSNRFGNLNYQNSFNYSKNERNSINRFGNILNYSLSGVSVNNNLQWVNYKDDTQNTVLGSTIVQKRFGSVGTRFNLNYAIKPEAEILNYEIQLNRMLWTSFDTELTLKNQLTSGIKTAELGVNWYNEYFSLNSSIDYNSEDEWKIGLFSRFSFGVDTANNDYFINRRSLVSYGSLLVHVFLDENNNGVFDEGESHVEGVKIKALQNYRRGATDKNGMALLSSMTANLTTDIVVDPRSFPDPFYVAANDGFSFTPRAGFVEYMEIPLNNSGEIEGTVYQEMPDSKTVAGFATVNLLDKKGNEVATTKAAYDGYYLFTDLRPGEYTAVVNEEFKTRKALKETQKINVNLSAKGDVVAEVDFVLQQKKQVEGYIVNLGTFSSLNILKAYYWLVQKHLSDLNTTPFYVQDKTTKQFVLALAYDKTQSLQLEDACSAVKAKKLPCNVQKQSISH